MNEFHNGKVYFQYIYLMADATDERKIKIWWAEKKLD